MSVTMIVWTIKTCWYIHAVAFTLVFCYTTKTLRSLDSIFIWGNYKIFWNKFFMNSLKGGYKFFFSFEVRLVSGLRCRILTYGLYLDSTFQCGAWVKHVHEYTRSQWLVRGGQNDWWLGLGKNLKVFWHFFEWLFPWKYNWNTVYMYNVYCIYVYCNNV